MFEEKEAITIFYEDNDKKEIDEGERNKPAGKLAIKTKLLFEIE